MTDAPEELTPTEVLMRSVMQTISAANPELLIAMITVEPTDPRHVNYLSNVSGRDLIGLLRASADVLEKEMQPGDAP